MFDVVKYKILKDDGSIYKIDSFSQNKAMPVSEAYMKKTLESAPLIANDPQLKGGFEVEFIKGDSQ